ncbi:hypothetical protein JOC54_004452 [Alkalihalobacillus xiaoxiensis]|uniref:ABC transporter permease n=1 Tax=Shouchella xiaoxiensis TaxID=766895 RepID=A0ABS2T1L5_9BACI|nr:hypothetical protein [Shouchella xiaoxiensis]MBM7841151.1 hypothetical protein [Shouchella xiaoxiensis]
MNYIKLTHFELKRVMPWFVGLLVLFAIAQTLYLFFHQHFLYQTMQHEFQYGLSIEQFVRDYGPVSIVAIADQSFFYLLPFYASFISVCLYAVFIWYREWVGKHSFIYRLLLLPINRVNLLFSKLTAILIMLLTVYTLQIALIPLHELILHIRLPAAMVEKSSTFFFMNLFTPIWPVGYTDIHWLLILKSLVLFLLFLITLSTMILLERSFRIKGFLGACLFALFSFCSYIGISLALDHTIYPSELIIVQIAFCLLLIGLNLFLSYRLLHSYITA